jgi:hypothetical protein
MDVFMLICALVLVGIGVDILRFPKLPPPTQQQDDEAIFGKVIAAGLMRRIHTTSNMRYGGAPRSLEMRILACILLVAGLVLGAKSLGVI